MSRPAGIWSLVRVRAEIARRPFSMWEGGSMPTTALVLGGSIAGLLTAGVLAGAYDEVIVVERDRLPLHASRPPASAPRPQQRRGVPHGRHVHGMLPRGQQVVEELLPGLTEQLVADGGLPGDTLANIRWYLRGRRLRQVDI